MRRFAQLFAGRADCYGRYRVTEQKGQKQKGRGQTVHEPLTDQIYQSHLAGEIRLGVVPIRVDGKVSWFAGDIDLYDVDLQAIERKVQKHELPIVVCRSKSGGAHLYCFVSGEPIPARLGIDAMRHFLKVLGYETVKNAKGVSYKPEVFPKQEEVTEETTGNWINLPYHNAYAVVDNYAIGISGEQLKLEEFERLAYARSVSEAELREFVKAKPAKKEKAEHADAPPCVERMFAEKIGEGGRNNALTHVGIYFLKSDSDNWRDRTVAANFQIFEEPLPMEEVNQIARNVSKAKYEYLCNLEPMCSLCDKELCGTRKWGVGPQRGISYSDCDIDRIIKIDTDPPVYIVVINGAQIKMNTNQLLRPGAFRQRVYEVTGELIAPVKERQHEARIQAAKVEVERAPEEVSEEGQIFEAFQEWCEIHIPNSRNLEEVLRGNPFYDKDRASIIFRGQDFISALKRAKKFNLADRDVWAALRKRDCESTNTRIRGKQIKVWTYRVDKPWFDTPTEESF